MTVGYDIERLKVALEAVEGSAAALARHKMPDWLQHRLGHIRGEVRSLKELLVGNIERKETEWTRRTLQVRM